MYSYWIEMQNTPSNNIIIGKGFITFYVYCLRLVRKVGLTTNLCLYKILLTKVIDLKSLGATPNSSCLDFVLFVPFAS